MIPLIVKPEQVMSRGERAALQDATTHGIRHFGRRLYAIDAGGPFHAQAVVERLHDKGLIQRVGGRRYKARHRLFE